MTYLAPDPDQDWRPDFTRPVRGKPKFVEVEGPYHGLPGQRGKLTEEQILALYRDYRAGASVTKLALRIWRTVGYASATTAEDCLKRMFHRRGLAVRSRAEAVQLYGAKLRERTGAPPRWVKGKTNPAYHRWWRARKRDDG